MRSPSQSLWSGGTIHNVACCALCAVEEQGLVQHVHASNGERASAICDLIDEQTLPHCHDVCQNDSTVAPYCRGCLPASFIVHLPSLIPKPANARDLQPGVFQALSRMHEL